MKWLLSPLTWLLLAVLVGFLAVQTRRRWPRVLCVALVSLSLSAMTPLVANTLTAYLERPVVTAPGCRATPPAVVVVIAGGVDRTTHDPADFTVLNLASRRRVERGVRYWRERDGRHIVLSGGAMPPGNVAHAELMRSYSRWLGVPESAISIEPRSLDTWQNGRDVAEMIPALPRRIALVTSAMHMPRAVLAFQAAGFQACPLPCDFRTVPIRAPGSLTPRTSALLKTETALHELLGLGYYHWRIWRAHA
jgi:uncharacterized SAM-binding protein YcdF (DUF218 family)